MLGIREGSELGFKLGCAVELELGPFVGFNVIISVGCVVG